MLSISAHGRDDCVPNIDVAQLQQWMVRQDMLLWIDIENPTDEDFNVLSKEFRFHPLALEDVQNSHQRPKVDLYADHAFLVFYAVSYNEEEHHIHTHEVELFVGNHFIVTIHDDPIPDLQQTHMRWQQNAPIITEHVGTLLYTILDTILDAYFPVLDQVAEHLDELEDAIFEEYDPSILKEALRMKRDLLGLRRVVSPQRDVVNVLLRGDHQILPPEATPYLQDLYDHALRIVENVDTYREMVTAVMEGFLTVQSNNVNEVMRRLTVINLLFLPLTVLTGFFGMNFAGIPFGNPLLLVFALSAMVLFPGGLYLWLRRQQWG